MGNNRDKIFLAIIAVLVFIILLKFTRTTNKDHYTLYIESDTIKVYNDDKVIYKEYINYTNPNKLQQAIIKDNQ